ncbi:MAG: hypothetical protein J3K34DRAFT_517734 [Monoraphidium minutum]|nr:MAG: hypothetical protein J3K34DRAFT_517734 [Monoraphidium minutum]
MENMGSNWKRQQTVVVLVGLPGAGKSTLSHKLASHGWTVVNQDVLGNRKKCEAACKEALLAGRSVVIDRVNFSEAQRAVWVQLGRAVCGSALRLIVLQLVVPIETCKARMREEARRAAGGGAPKDTDHLVDSFAADLTLVDPWSEGFDQVYTISKEEQAEAFVAHVTAAPSAPAGGGGGGGTAAARGAPAAQQAGGGGGSGGGGEAKPAAAVALAAAGSGMATPIAGGVATPTAAAPAYYWAAGGAHMQAAAAWGGAAPWAAAGVPGAYGVAMFPYGAAMPMHGMGWVPMLPAQYAAGVRAMMPGMLAAPGAGAGYVPVAAGGGAAPMMVPSVAAAAAMVQQQQAPAAAAAAAPPPAPGGEAGARARRAPPRRAISQLTPQDMPPWWRPKGAGDEGHHQGPPPGEVHPYAAAPVRSSSGAATPALGQHPGAPYHHHHHQQQQQQQQQPYMYAHQQQQQHQQQPYPGHSGPLPPVQPWAADAMGAPRARRPPGRSATFTSGTGAGFSGAPRPFGGLPPPPLFAGGSRLSSGRPSPAHSRRCSYEAPAAAHDAAAAAARASFEGDGDGGDPQQQAKAAGGGDDDDVPPGQLACSRPGVMLDALPPTGPECLRGGGGEAGGAPGDDGRIILLFDLNGTLVSHASRRRSAGNSRLRPGLGLLARLLPRFRLGLYTSSTGKTVCVLRGLLEAAAGVPLFEPGLTLYRDHTRPAPMSHVRAGGKPWDTVKPLGHWFSRMHRVVLLDDDAYKAVAGEEANLVEVPAWLSESPSCDVLTYLVAAVEEVFGSLGPDGDVREHTARVCAMLPPSPAPPAPRGGAAGAGVGPRPRLPQQAGAAAAAAAAAAAGLHPRRDALARV